MPLVTGQQGPVVARGAGEVSITTSLFTGSAQVQEGQRGPEVIWALFM